ncbi:TetR/AcrR family transcriptional regulator [Microbacterium sp.]|uniref:TetR/AcrR family transcriptional regulator n=1 Tax=Microbacterium sp. TaxID=51671 RepID=UPI0027349BE0|nr:TetR/AcrR family transcriptional regulator [Microbacterium sp.]MDP3952956.1 TetR/AcrR family transcriptional regulator [Microbacterium sp.]
MASSESPSRTFTETARRAQLIAAAITTVNEIGYHRASLSEIAQRAGVAKSAIVYYFSSKEALLLSVLEDVFTRLEIAVAQAVDAEAEPPAQLRAYARGYLSYVDGHRAEVTAGLEIVVSHRTEDGTPLYLTGTEEDSQVLRGILSAGMDDGVFRRMPLKVAVALVEALLDVPTTELQRDLNANIEPFAVESVEALMKGFTV